MLALVQVFLLLIGQQGLGHFFRYRPLLPIGWRIVQTLFGGKRAKQRQPLLVQYKRQANSDYTSHVIKKRPTYQLVMLLWRDFMYTEICGGYAIKSSKLFFNSAPKVEQ